MAENITGATHPSYDAMATLWTKYRFTYNGGKDFVEEYLEQFSKREDTTDFITRRNISYAPSHAKAAIIEIKNAIYQRMASIKRTNGPQSYQDAVQGINKGVDLNGSAMTDFIGRKILPELLIMARVGVFVDKPAMPEISTKATTRNIIPYLYMFAAEDIRAWTYNNDNILTSLLIRKHVDVVDDNGLTIDTEEQYLLLKLEDDGVHAETYNINGEIIENIVIKLSRIPFVIFEINMSLLTDAADMQIALLNMESSDINYALKANFPFYTEQYDALTEQFTRQGTAPTDDDKSGEAHSADVAKAQEIKVGVAQGRKYPKGVERPQFIHPSSEPLKISMEKEEQIKQSIRQVVNLNITNIEPRRASAESKKEDVRTLESGLSYIGMELEYGERQIAAIWAEYEGSDDVATVRYPIDYSLLTDKERRAEADALLEFMPKLPSSTYQKAVAKQVADMTIGYRIDPDTVDKIHEEIDRAIVIVIDSEIIERDHKQGLISDETASTARGYPKEEVEQAKKDHAERLARIKIAQTGPAARGNPDEDDNIDSGKNEKDKSKLTDEDIIVDDKTRGEGK